MHVRIEIRFARGERSSKGSPTRSVLADYTQKLSELRGWHCEIKQF